MNSDCIFCKIANGEIPSSTIYEDEMFRVILDLSPATKGHALILPKKHMANIFEMDEETAETVRDLAVRAFHAMDLKGVVRIDFILDRENHVFINEANTIPGSLAFYLWEPKGISFSALLDGMVECAFNAYADRRASVFSYDSSILSHILRGSKGAKGKLGR